MRQEWRRYFNWKVLQFPVRLVDYIIMHELVHLVEGHHGSAFWQALERAMPDWPPFRLLPTLTRCFLSQLYLDHSHRPVLAPATLASLPSTRSIETHLLPLDIIAVEIVEDLQVAFVTSPP